MAFSKVILNGTTLMDLTSDTVTTDKLLLNYTAHDASGSSIIGTASGGGGGYNASDFVDASKPTGVLSFNNVSFPSNATWLNGRTGITKLIGVNYNDTSSVTYKFAGMTGLEYLVFPSATKTNSRDLEGCSNLLAVDMLGGSLGGVTFNNCTKLAILVLRKSDAIVTLSNTNAFNGTPFASGKSGGVLYVPNSLISSYQSASNWSTILEYSTNSIQKIEGSIYENAYVDGTPIS